MKVRATKFLAQQRIEAILRIRLDGAEFWDVREYAREKEQEAGSAWELKEGDKPLSDGQLWRYVAAADKLIAESCRASRKKLLRRHLAQRRNLYAKAVAAGDHRTALAVLADEAKLQGLYPPVKIAPTTPDGQDAWLPTPAERDQLVAAELARLGIDFPVPAGGGPLNGNGQAPSGPGEGAAPGRL